LIITTGFDHKIKVFKKSKDKYEFLREIWDCLNGHEINILELSV
jgi:hypothetical protein